MARKKISKKREIKEEAFEREDMRSEIIFFGLLIAVLGLIWLAKEVGWLVTNLSIGPLIIIIIGLTIVYKGLRIPS